MTPYAVEDRGDGRFAVLVYDNNHPGVTRAVSFDRKADAWRFVAQTNPDDRNQVYGGDAKAANIAVFRSQRLSGHLPCPFCDATAAAARKHAMYNEIALEGDPANHAHMLLTDRRGRRTGYVGGRFVQEIPGVQVVRRLNNQDWLEESEPVLRVPTGTPVEATIDGARLKHPVVERLVVVGPGVDAAVEGIELRRGERVVVGLAGDEEGLSVRTDSHHGESPVLRLGYTAHPDSYDVTVHAHVLPPDSPRYFATPELSFAIRLLQAHGGLNISASHNPFQDNGIKFFSSEGYKLPDDVELAQRASAAEQVADDLARAQLEAFIEG